MAVGLPMKTTYADGDVYSAQDVNDITGTINLVAQTQNFYAGKNAVINGDFRINQRGFTSGTTYDFGFDRFVNAVGGGTGTGTFSAQTFTPGTAPVSGYNGVNYLRCVTTGQTAAGTYTIIQQNIEDVRTFAGQTATISFWAKANSGTPKIFVELEQFFGSGGSASVQTGSAVTLTTSWARYSITLSVPSLSGKTIGAASYLSLLLWVSAGSTFNTRTSSLGIQSNTFEVWGVQLEAGSTATAFEIASGTVQGELALCQRYFSKSYNQSFAPGSATSGGLESRMSANRTDRFAIDYSASLPVVMRAAPTVTVYSTATGASGNIRDNGAGADRATTAINIGEGRYQILLNSGVSTTANAGHSWQWTASAEF